MVKTLRLWTLLTLPGVPMLYGVIFLLFPEALYGWESILPIAGALASLFVPILLAARKSKDRPPES